MLTCSACGRQAADDAVICPECGESLLEQPAPAPRPPVVQSLWVYLVFGVYVLLMATITFGPVLAAMAGGSLEGLGAALVFALIVAVCGASLVVIPIRAARDLPNTQRSIWLPLLGSATLAMALFGGFALAAHEFTFGGKSNEGEDAFVWGAFAALPVVWIGWAVLFGTMACRREPERFAGRLYKSLLAGSVLELLIAIPMHMVVRQRGYCCAGFGTGMGIGIGILIMLIALGPAVVFLFYRRYQQAYARHPARPE